jgi:hypothetical protein
LVYAGSWKKDRYDGKGELLEIYSCCRYKGEFQRGFKHGNGFERHDGVGGEYRGVWEGGMMHGTGVYRYSDGSEWARRYHRGELLTDELIGGPNQMVDGLSNGAAAINAAGEGAGGGAAGVGVAGAMEEGWRLQVKAGDEFNPAKFETPRVDFTQAQDYAERMAKLRSRHRAVLLSVEQRVTKELKQQGSGFSQRQKAKVMLVAAMRHAMEVARRAAVAREATEKKEADEIRHSKLRTMPSATLDEEEEEAAAADETRAAAAAVV